MKALPCIAWLFAAALTCVSLNARAEVVYVDQRMGGTTASPYVTIQLAINDSNATKVIIRPGVYKENLTINRNIKLVGYDGPNTTAVDGSAGEKAINIYQGLVVTIEGLKISSASTGIYQPTAGTLYVRNCVICGNTSRGIYVEKRDENTPYVYVDNCVFIANTGDGLYMRGFNAGTGSNFSYIPVIRLYNCIFVGNGR